MAIAYNARIPTRDLLIYIDVANKKCYSGSGSTFNNLADYTNYASATFGGTTSYGTVSDNVIVLTGAGSSTTTGAYITGSGSIAETINADFTTIGWQKATSQYGEVMSYRQASFRLSFDVSGSNMHFYQRETTNPFTTNSTGVSTTNSLNTWYCYALVKSGTSYSFYKNGVLIGTNTFNITETLGSGTAWHIGAAWSDDDYLSSSGRGHYGPHMHYTTDLTAAEISQVFEAQRGRFGV
tara:strand:+ start:507 stop:1220 length:714 start_codon:yes stop_codon:yes gene_type:complete